MDPIFNLNTIMLCTFLAMAATSAAMFLVWFTKPDERAAGLWSLSFLLGAGGFAVIAFGRVLHLHAIVPPLNFTLTTASYVGLWFGFRVFNGQPVKYWPVSAVVSSWLAAFLLWPEFRHNPDMTAAAQSTIVAVFSLASAYTVFTGRESRHLAMAIPAALLLLTHAVVHLGHLGFISLIQPADTRLGHSGPWGLMMLEVFIHTVSIAISCVVLIKDRSEEHHRIASETDSLTGIANRRAFVRDTEKHLNGDSKNATLAIIDIDHFKQINDKHGHQAGDEALVSFAKLVSENLPKGAIFGRLGGEEFGLFLPASVELHEDFLETLRREAEEQAISFDNLHIRLTVSIGAAMTEDAGAAFDALVAAADCALYLAKDSGRNRVSLFSPAQQLQKCLQENGQHLADDHTRPAETRVTAA